MYRDLIAILTAQTANLTLSQTKNEKFFEVKISRDGSML